MLSGTRVKTGATLPPLFGAKFVDEQAESRANENYVCHNGVKVLDRMMSEQKEGHPVLEMETTLPIVEQSRTLSAPRGPLVVPGLPDPPLKVSFIVPTYNEKHNVAELISTLGDALYSRVGKSFEIIVVDDDSPDRTWEVVAEIAGHNAHAISMRRVGERGLATAVVRGWQAARGEILGVIDGDLQHPPEISAELVDAIFQGADLAVASRRSDGGGVGEWSRWRDFGSRAAQWIGQTLLGKSVRRVSDPMSGYFAVRRATIAGIEMNPVGYKILAEVLCRTKPARVAEVGYVFRVRQHGESKASMRILWDYLIHVLRLRLGA